jgi:hypothetical protein
LFDYLDSFHTLFRDFICVAILFVINMIIVAIFRKAIRKKKTVLTYETNSTSESSKKDKLATLEKKTVMMMVMIGFSQIIGRFPTFLTNFLLLKLNTNDCFNEIATILFYIHSLINIFILYYFNNLIRKNIKSILFVCVTK